jgi:opacity protein-like surface antigen
MDRYQRALGGIALLAGLLLLPGASRAQESYTFTVAGLGGLGGSLDAEPGDDLSNTGYQLNLGMITDPQTHFEIRLGHLGLDGDELFGSLRDADLSYVTVGGEYRFNENWYDSGIYLALGGYRLEGTAPDGGESRDTSIGLALGATAEFKVNRWLGVLLELSGHYVDFDEAQIFGMGHGGLAVHF